MWREYFVYAATAFAVLNGLIAIAVALLPMRRSVLKLRLGAAALALAAFAVGATFYAQYSAYVRIERQQSEHAEIRHRLDALIVEGRTLLGRIRDDNSELPATAADQWAQRTEVFLNNNVGESSIARFRKNVDGLYGDDTSVAGARMGYWRAVRNRIVNLETIAAEFPEQPGRQP